VVASFNKLGLDFEESQVRLIEQSG
jgi:hypothetical protein